MNNRDDFGWGFNHPDMDSVWRSPAGRVRVETAKDVPLETTPHYSDRRFEREQTVFGKQAEELHYEYNDRLRQWDYAKHEAAWEVAKNSEYQARSANFYEAYLTAYFGKPIELMHVVAGVNASSGYPYCAFGFRYKDVRE